MTDLLAKAFELMLKAEEERLATATGATPSDYMYDQAESVRPVHEGKYAYATYKGTEYGPAKVTWGPIDASKEKSTVLIKTNDGIWVKLWFYDKDLHKQ